MIATYTQSCPRCGLPIIRCKTVIVWRDGQWVHVDCQPMRKLEDYPLHEVAPTPPPTDPIPQLGTAHSDHGLTRHAIYTNERVTVCGRINRDQLTLGAGPHHTSWCGRCYQTMGAVVAHAAQYGQGE